MKQDDLSNDPYVAAFPELAPFWRSAAHGTLSLPQCLDCEQTHWHPRSFCPLCGSARLNWRTGSGLGTLHTFSLVQRKDEPPYVLAYVELDEGPLMLTNIVDTDDAELRIGMRLHVAFRQTPEGRHAPVFRPTASENHPDP